VAGDRNDAFGRETVDFLRRVSREEAAR
jgi:hypothetical protein